MYSIGMQKQKIAIGLLIAVLLPIVLPNLAYAQYGGAAVNSPTLEENLKLAREKVAAVQADPQGGSGTPFLAADGMVTAMLVSAAVFGVLFGLFVWKAKAFQVPKELRR